MIYLQQNVLFMKTILQFAFALCLFASCKKTKDKLAPVWYETYDSSNIYLKLTYMGDTIPGSVDEVWVFSYDHQYADTLRGINKRVPGTVYNWTIKNDSRLQLYSLMRNNGNGSGGQYSVSSGSIHHTSEGH